MAIATLSPKRRIVSNSAIKARNEKHSSQDECFLLLCYIDLKKLCML